MISRENFDLSAYFVVGPENTKGRPVAEVVREALLGGFTFVQIRSKVASARELMEITAQTAQIIRELGKSDQVTLLLDDRLDVVLACRERGIKVDGIHVGQSDIPVDVCRRYLGEQAVIGLSARTDELFGYLREVDITDIDYFGAGPLHETATKPDCGLSAEGHLITRSLDEITELVRVSPLPVVLGGGVKLKDLPGLAATGVQGFFVVSAVSEADDVQGAATELVHTWKQYAR